MRRGMNKPISDLKDDLILYIKVYIGAGIATLVLVRLLFMYLNITDSIFE